MGTADEERVRRIEDLVRRLEQIPDPASRETSRALMEAILELHGAGIDRMMEIVVESGEPGGALIRQFGGDALVSSLLLLHGLHPDDLETRVRRALAKLPADVEVTGVFEDVVRVRYSGGGCGVRETIEQAIWTAAPDAAGVVVEETIQQNGFVPLTAIGMR